MNNSPIPILTIAGSDSGGGAGIQEDLKVFTLLGAYGASVITALTAQNTLGVHGVLPIPPEFVKAQLDAVLSDIRPQAIKLGMLAKAEIIEVVANALKRHAFNGILVIDPVMVAKGGHSLLASEAVSAMIQHLFPLADVITPNVEEASALLNQPIRNKQEAIDAALRLKGMLKDAASPAYRSPLKMVVLKGGHLSGEEAIDLLCCYNGKMQEYSLPRQHSKNTHGTGCTFSAALTTYLAQGKPVQEAVYSAKVLTNKAIFASFDLGAGIGPTNPLYLLQNIQARYQVLEELEKAWRFLQGFECRDIVPEIQTNLGYAIPYPELSWPQGAMDVAAFPGRIVGYEKGVARISPPRFGASSHVARIILTAMHFDGTQRSAMAVRYRPEFLQNAQRFDYKIAQFSRTNEPEESRNREGSSLIWGVTEAVRSIGLVPDLIYDLGDVGKEPVIRVLGKDPMEVVKKALRIGGLLLKDNDSPT